jgi:redox-sensitive bicupin YhaK (pirin superfamily)
VSIRRGADRHQTRIGWLYGRHSFDTGIDPQGTAAHHGMLVVSNHDTIAPRSGFETHPHRDQAAIRIRNRYAALHVARLDPGESVTIPGLETVR